MLLRGGSSQGEVAAVLHVSKRDVSEAAKAIKDYSSGKSTALLRLHRKSSRTPTKAFASSSRQRPTSWARPDTSNTPQARRPI